MTSYDIVIDYKTGDSFHTEEIKEESIGIVTSDINKAKENLKRIKKRHVEGNTERELILLVDEGTRIIYPFWEGYFETLRGAKIVIDDSDMHFTTENIY